MAATNDLAQRDHLISLGWTPPAGDAEAKTVPVPTRVHLIGETAVIVGTPGRGWDEDAHNCDAMGCATIGPHVLARVPFTDERAMSQAAEAQAQGGGEVCRFDPSEADRHRCYNCGLRIADHVPDEDGARCKREAVRQLREITAPPSAPVGVEAIREAFDEISGLCRHLRQGGPVPEDLQDLSDALDEAVGIAANMLELLKELFSDQ